MMGQLTSAWPMLGPLVPQRVGEQPQILMLQC